jgi:hypothetical protein
MKYLLPQLPVYICRRISCAFTVDGDLSKPVWKAIPFVDLRSAFDQGKLSQTTKFGGCWDGENLYLAFKCQDTDIRGTFAQRDDCVWMEEAVEAFIAPYDDFRHYFEFQCSPTNVVRDVKVTNPNNRGERMIFEGSWDCSGWQTAVSVNSDSNRPSLSQQGWAAEWRIKLSELLDNSAGPVLPGEEWRVNIYRIDRWPKEEYSGWSATPGLPLSFHRPTCFGRWIFD